MLPVLWMMNRLSSQRRHRISGYREIEGPEYCRTCLSTRELTFIFKSKDAEKRSQELRLTTGLEIKINDGLSQKICKTCVDTIQNNLKFRRTSRKVHKSLLLMKLNSHYSKVRKLQTPKLEIQVESLGYDFDNDFGQDELPTDYQHEEDKPKKERQKTIKVKKKIGIANSSSYKCHSCGKEFRMKSTYRAHLRFHTSYCVCESCGKRCRNNNQLQEHKRARHGLGKIHKCAYCEYSSATKEALTIHERRHTGERPYICDHCGATFHRRANLVQHIAIHLPEKNFQCDMCPKRLKSRKFLQIHKHNAHTGKRFGYLCPVCEHRFEKPNKVRAHARRVHGLPDEHIAPIIRVQL
ncbi:unnamed protein product [Leptidea sinapis]|uniref:Protein krueppel n=1 Tax=Leptidea sinapis TaxID=189913 RepID=A0A5E4R6M9_9NEOP|nr:unnamed protein product [Leptidea sinapis]